MTLTHISGWRCGCWVTRPAGLAPGTGQTASRAWGWRVEARPGSPCPLGWCPPSRPRWTPSPGSSPRPRGQPVWSGCWAGTCLHFSEPGSRCPSSPWWGLNFARISERHNNFKLCILNHILISNTHIQEKLATTVYCNPLGWFLKFQSTFGTHSAQAPPNPLRGEIVPCNLWNIWRNSEKNRISF